MADFLLLINTAIPLATSKALPPPIPIIASNLPEMGKIINEYGIGYLVTHDDLNGQIESITKILNNKKEKEIQKIAEQYLVWETQENLFLNTLNSNG